MNVLQQTNASSFTARGVNKTFATATGSFVHTTQLNSLLLCVCQLQVVASQAGSYPPAVFPIDFEVTTPGFTWTLIGQGICPTAFEYISGNHNVGTVAVAIYAIEAAAIMSSSAVISVTGNASASAASVLVNAIIQEVSGPTALNFVVGPNYGSGSSVPSVGNIVETNTNDYLITVECDEQLAISSFGSQWSKKESAGGWYLSYVLNTTPQTYTPAYTAVDTPTVWAALAAAFSAALPTIASVMPNSGPVAGGQSCMITGTNFVSGATVSFGGNAATDVVVVSPTEITCVTPAGSAGTVNVSVTTTGGTGTLDNGYTYVAPPSVTPSSITMINRVFGFTPRDDQEFPDIVSLSINPSGSTVASSAPWLVITGNVVTVNYKALPQASNGLTQSCQGQFIAYLTFTNEGGTTTVQVTLEVGYGGYVGLKDLLYLTYPVGSSVNAAGYPV